MQNTSYAVMAQRREPRNSPDDFPTPPWATRALMEYVLDTNTDYGRQVCLEPACGVGHMARVLEEYFSTVLKSDAYDYGYGEIKDFFSYSPELPSVDWVITNPPFRLSERFVLHARNIARKGIAVLARTVFLESIGRYHNLFKPFPPTKFAQFSERVPMLKGRLDRKGTTATGYAWLVWELESGWNHSQTIWIPPCRKELERDTDYE